MAIKKQQPVQISSTKDFEKVRPRICLQLDDVMMKIRKPRPSFSHCRFVVVLALVSSWMANGFALPNLGAPRWTPNTATMIPRRLLSPACGEKFFRKRRFVLIM